jgi:hypothetical protein
MRSRTRPIRLGELGIIRDGTVANTAVFFVQFEQAPLQSRIVGVTVAWASDGLFARGLLLMPGTARPE